MLFNRGSNSSAAGSSGANMKMDEPEALMDTSPPSDIRPAYKHHNHTQKAFEVLNVLRRYFEQF